MLINAVCSLEHHAAQFCTDKPSLKVLTNLLTGDVYWYQLGINLGLPGHVLKEIEENHSRADRRRAEVVQYYFDNEPRPTWEAFAAAVEKMKLRNLAKRIREAGGRSLKMDKPVTD